MHIYIRGMENRGGVRSLCDFQQLCVIDSEQLQVFHNFGLVVGLLLQCGIVLQELKCTSKKKSNEGPHET